jgi:RNA polymerase sigma-70 factor (ECF subfamily)
LDLDEEKRLISDMRSDPSKFGVVFDAHYASIFGYIFHRIADYDIARDIASETFLKAFLNIRSFKWKGVSISFWIYRIATNEIQQYFRNKKYSFESLESLIDSTVWDAVDPVSTVEEKTALEKEMQKHKDYVVIQKKMKLLPMVYQEVLALRYFEQKNIKEVAIILNKREGTVKSLLSRGIEKLKRML